MSLEKVEIEENCKIIIEHKVNNDESIITTLTYKDVNFADLI